MSNLTCVSCNQRKKEENFSDESLSSGTPTCAGCDVKLLMKRIEDSKRSIMSIGKQQQGVISITKKVEENITNKPKKTTAHSRLQTLLQSETA